MRKRAIREWRIARRSTTLTPLGGTSAWRGHYFCRPVSRGEAIASNACSIGFHARLASSINLIALAIASPLRLTFHNLDLVVGQPVQLIHQRIDLLISRVNLALNQVAVMGGLGGGQTRMQLQHGVHQFDHAIMRGFVGGVGEVDGADGQLFDKAFPI